MGLGIHYVSEMCTALKPRFNWLVIIGFEEISEKEIFNTVNHLKLAWICFLTYSDKNQQATAVWHRGSVL